MPLSEQDIDNTTADAMPFKMANGGGMYLGQCRLARRSGTSSTESAAGKRKFWDSASFRGIEKIRSEFKLVCAALNLRRMVSMTV